ncbi:MAG: pyruvate carboxylase [Eubacteriaceae bacterium]|nr:pyruvate carboxylase [Eubacteriaceae bacterium]
MSDFKRVLIANRGEIAIRIIRTVQELNKQAIAVYCEEDKLSLFKTKADESHILHSPGTPTEAYLNIQEIINTAASRRVDAIHPGYGFLAENPEFARACRQAGIKFIGPSPEVIELLGNKINAKEAAREAGVPIIDGEKVDNAQEARLVAKRVGYPVMIKASAGGGGRGMRVCEKPEEMAELFEAATREALKAFGNGEVFIEKYVTTPRHVEVQILGDEFGNIVHLYERDCSIQRRHQKIIEFTPCQSITNDIRMSLCEDAIKIARHVGYTNAGTVEFLLDPDGNHFFIEVNPRIQVEHTVTEQVCGIDLVQAQILIAEGKKLSDPAIGINSQDDIQPRGAAIECRITTENVQNNFLPDTGKIEVYKTPGGPGVRLDGGNGFTGAVISPYFDSLLVKTTTYGANFESARRTMVRALKETVIEGVSTNKDFLINILENESFRSGICNTLFIDKHPELFNLKLFSDWEYKLLKFIAERSRERGSEKPLFNTPISVPQIKAERKDGLKKILDEQGTGAVVRYINDTNELLFTDTSLRDAHQSLFATRLRTLDMLKIADNTAKLQPELFSLEMWGGATFDTAYRFLKESPWTRLKNLRAKIPNIMFQMLLRSSNAVGYTNYPDNLIREFIRCSAESGIDVFRIFDSLNWMEQIKVSCEETLKQGKIAEVAICYTGDILDKSRNKYNLDYYIKKAKEVEAMGAHILCIKDMGGLLKPWAAFELVQALKAEVKMPIHLHTHDTSGNGVACVLFAAKAGVDIADGALSSMSGLTSQPSLNSIVAALEFNERQSSLELDNLELLSDYYEKITPMYSSFESGIKTNTTLIYKYEVPGGQYSNLKAQVDSFGMENRFNEILEKYKEANDLFGDIIKVTPSSKVVGDMAIFMLQNDLSIDNIFEKGKDIAFPESVVEFFKGLIGQPEFGFDEELRKIILKGAEYITVRPGLLLEPVDFKAIKAEYKEKYDYALSDNAATSAAIYPEVYEEYVQFLQEYGDFIDMESDVFFYGLNEGESFDFSQGEYKPEDKRMLNVADRKHHFRRNIKLVSIGKIDDNGFRPFTFEVDGFRREIQIEDKQSLQTIMREEIKIADDSNLAHIGSPIPGSIVKVMVESGDTVAKGQAVAVVEAMKMETEILARADGVVAFVHVKPAQVVKAKELVIELDKDSITN